MESYEFAKMMEEIWETPFYWKKRPELRYCENCGYEVSPEFQCECDNEE